MDFLPDFWAGLFKIVGVNVVLSGDNAVVIALASRALAPHLRNKAIWLGAGGAVGLRLIFSFFIVALMAMPFLKIIGALFLLWIGIKMLLPERPHGAGKDGAASSIWGAVKTIILADAIMSLDNVIAIAAAANGNILLIAIGLGLSVPLIIYGSTLILKVLIRFPVLVMAGAGLIGWIAGETWFTDPAVSAWTSQAVASYGDWVATASAASGAVLVLVLGRLAGGHIAARQRETQLVDLATEDEK